MGCLLDFYQHNQRKFYRHIHHYSAHLWHSFWQRPHNHYYVYIHSSSWHKDCLNTLLDHEGINTLRLLQNVRSIWNLIHRTTGLFNIEVYSRAMYMLYDYKTMYSVLCKLLILKSIFRISAVGVQFMFCQANIEHSLKHLCT